MSRLFAPGATSQSVTVQILDDTGLAVTGLVAATFPAISYKKAGPTAAVSITLADLAAITTAWASGGVKEISGGYYRLDLPDAALSTATGLTIIGDASGKHLICPPIDVQYPQTDLQTIKSQAVTAAAGVTFPASIGTSTLTAAGVWDALTAGITTANSIGKRLLDFVTTLVYAAPPAAAPTAPQIADAVLDELMTEHKVTGSLAWYIHTLGIKHEIFDKNYYVDAAGSNLNSGLTVPLAFATFAKATSVATFADRIVAIKGTFPTQDTCINLPHGVSLYGPVSLVNGTFEDSEDDTAPEGGLICPGNYSRIVDITVTGLDPNRPQSVICSINGAADSEDATRAHQKGSKGVYIENLVSIANIDNLFIAQAYGKAPCEWEVVRSKLGSGYDAAAVLSAPGSRVIFSETQITIDATLNTTDFGAAEGGAGYRARGITATGGAKVRMVNGALIVSGAVSGPVLPSQTAQNFGVRVETLAEVDLENVGFAVSGEGAANFSIVTGGIVNNAGGYVIATGAAVTGATNDYTSLSGESHAASADRKLDDIDGGIGSGAGDGDYAIDHDGGTGLADAVATVDGVDSTTDILQYAISGVGVDGVTIKAYLKSAYDAGNRDATPPTTHTGSDGRWTAPLMLDSGTYYLVADAPGRFETNVKTLVVP